MTTETATGVQAKAWWHYDRTPGRECNHVAHTIGGECRRPDSGTWTPLVPAYYGHEPSAYDTAVEILLNSALLDQSQMDAFWAFCDDEITEDELREALR